jgi:hypothetical protein
MLCLSFCSDTMCKAIFLWDAMRQRQQITQGRATFKAKQTHILIIGTTG